LWLGGVDTTGGGRRDPAPMKVLLVDDDSGILNAGEQYFKKRGVEVLRSDTALGVTAIVREKHPDVVVLDVMMPLLSGSTLAGYLKQLTAMKSVPIIFFSAMDEEKLRALAREAEVPYVSKADGFPGVYDAIQTALRT
jgi:DNA-binding response OmpR family regulator